MATLLGITKEVPRLFVVIVIAILTLGAIVIWLAYRSLINVCAARVAQIEIAVNEQLGQNVLIWESRLRNIPRRRREQLLEPRLKTRGWWANQLATKQRLWDEELRQRLDVERDSAQ